MAEDQNYRSYRSSESIARTGQSRSASTGAANPASDPLAELARLIGQSDPFGDAMNAPARQAEAAGAPPGVDWSAPATQPHAGQSLPPADFSYAPTRAEPEPQPEQVHGYAQQSWSQPFVHMNESEGLYQVEQEIPSYLTNRAGTSEPVPQAYAPADEQFDPQQDDYYDELPSSRRRVGVVVVAAMFGLAVLGTAGAFGYRALFGSGSRVPPVIQADKAPLKVVPANAQAGKAIADRVAEQGEKIVPREEKPVDITQLVQSSAPPLASAGNGVVAGEPKKVHTVVIRPDGSGQPVAMASPMPPETAAPPAAAPQTAAPVAPPTAPARPKTDREPGARAAQAPAPQIASSNAPLSLSPEAAPASRPVHTANAGPATAAQASVPAHSHVTAYAVQVASQKSEAEAKAAYQSVLKKYPKVLEGKSMFVYSVNLGAKGTYYRAMVGPYSVASEASEICSALKSAGGSCLIQRN